MRRTWWTPITHGLRDGWRKLVAGPRSAVPSGGGRLADACVDEWATRDTAGGPARGTIVNSWPPTLPTPCRTSVLLRLVSCVTSRREEKGWLATRQRKSYRVVP